MRRLAPLFLLILLVALAGACGLVLGLSDHQPYPGDASTGDTGADVGPCGDTRSNPQNCGACGTICAAGYACAEGICGNRVAQLAAGGGFACVLLHGGEVWCWGSNASGQLGVPVASTPDCGGQCRGAPAKVPGLTTAVEISAGTGSVCARLADGSVSCWGLNDVDQLGHANSADKPCAGLPCNPTPQPIPGLPPSKQISGGWWAGTKGISPEPRCSARRKNAARIAN